MSAGQFTQEELELAAEAEEKRLKEAKTAHPANWRQSEVRMDGSVDV